MKGKITTYFRDKQFGFIQGDDGKKYFFHRTNFKNETDVEYLRKNLKVDFTDSFNSKGDFADNIIVDEMSYPYNSSASETNQDYVYRNLKTGIQITKWYFGISFIMFFTIIGGVSYSAYTYFYKPYFKGSPVFEEIYEGNPDTYYLNDVLINKIRTIISFERGFAKFFDTRLGVVYYPNKARIILQALDDSVSSKYGVLTNECKKITNEDIDYFISYDDKDMMIGYLNFSNINTPTMAYGSHMKSLNRRYQGSLILNDNCKTGAYMLGGDIKKVDEEELTAVDRVAIYQGKKQYLSLHKLKDYVALKDPFLHFVNEQIFYNTKANAYVIVDTESGIINIYAKNYINKFYDILQNEIANGDLQILNRHNGLLEQNKDRELKTSEEKEINRKIVNLYEKLASDKYFTVN